MSTKKYIRGDAWPPFRLGNFMAFRVKPLFFPNAERNFGLDQTLHYVQSQQAQSDIAESLVSNGHNYVQKTRRAWSIT